jgi:ribosomal protein S18 acetylase RimI-like enzyme
MPATLTKFEQIKIAYHSRSNVSSVAEILDFLQLATHWSSDRSDSELLYSIQNSLSAYVTYDGDRIVGFGRIIGDGYHLAILTDIACHPDYRGQAIATNIVKSLCADVPHCRTIRAMTSQAKGLYEKLGFVEYSGDTMELVRENF